MRHRTREGVGGTHTRCLDTARPRGEASARTQSYAHADAEARTSERACTRRPSADAPGRRHGNHAHNMHGRMPQGRLHGAAKAVDGPALRPEGCCPHRRFRVAIQEVLLQALRVRPLAAHSRRHRRRQGLRHRRPLRQSSPPAIQSRCGAGYPRRPRLRHRFPARFWRQLRKRSCIRDRPRRGRSGGGRVIISSWRFFRRRLRPPRFPNLVSGGHGALLMALARTSFEPKHKTTTCSARACKHAHTCHEHKDTACCALRSVQHRSSRIHIRTAAHCTVPAS